MSLPTAYVTIKINLTGAQIIEALRPEYGESLVQARYYDQDAFELRSGANGMFAIVPDVDGVDFFLPGTHYTQVKVISTVTADDSTYYTNESIITVVKEVAEGLSVLFGSTANVQKS